MSNAMETTQPQRYKCAVVGNGAIGKTCLIKATTGNAAANMHEYMPTGRCEFHPTTITIHETQCTIDFWDTPGLDYEHFRGLPTYFNVQEELANACAVADIFLLCFAICDPESFRSVKDKWHLEVREHRPGKPVVLLGLKLDSRDDGMMLEMLRKRNKVPVSFEEGRKMARDVGAVEYLECSVKTGKGIGGVLGAVGRALR